MAQELDAEHAECLKKKDIDGKQLLKVTEEELVKWGIPDGPARKLLRAVEAQASYLKDVIDKVQQFRQANGLPAKEGPLRYKPLVDPLQTKQFPFVGRQREVERILTGVPYTVDKLLNIFCFNAARGVGKSRFLAEIRQELLTALKEREAKRELCKPLRNLQNRLGQPAVHIDLGSKNSPAGRSGVLLGIDTTLSLRILYAAYVDADRSQASRPDDLSFSSMLNFITKDGTSLFRLPFSMVLEHVTQDKRKYPVILIDEAHCIVDDYAPEAKNEALETFASLLSCSGPYFFLAGAHHYDLFYALRKANALPSIVMLKPLSMADSRQLVGQKFLTGHYPQWQSDGLLHDALAHCGGIPRALTELVLSLFKDGMATYAGLPKNLPSLLGQASQSDLWRVATFANVPSQDVVVGKAWWLNLHAAVVRQSLECLSSPDLYEEARIVLAATVASKGGNVPFFAPAQVDSIVKDPAGSHFPALIGLRDLGAKLRAVDGVAAGFTLEEWSMLHFRAFCLSWASLEFRSIGIHSLLCPEEGLWSSDTRYDSIPFTLVDLADVAFEVEQAESALRFFDRDGSVVPFDYPVNTVVKNAPGAKGVDWAVKLKDTYSQYKHVVLAFQSKTRTYFNQTEANENMDDVFGPRGVSARECNSGRELLILVLQSVGGAEVRLPKDEHRHVVIQQGADLLKFFGPTVAALGFHWSLHTCSTTALQLLLGVSSKDHQAVKLIDERRKVPGSIRSLDDVEELICGTEAHESIGVMRQLERFGALSCTWLEPETTPQQD